MVAACHLFAVFWSLGGAVGQSRTSLGQAHSTTAFVRTKVAPFIECFGLDQLETASFGEATFLIDVFADGGTDGSGFLRPSHVTKLGHRLSVTFEFSNLLLAHRPISYLVPVSISFSAAF